MLYNKLKDYSKLGIYPFHMPGHKRIAVNNDTVIPYNLDLTEIYDFDNLHSANGCIKDVQTFAEKLYQVKHAFLLVNGATGGILSAIRAMTKYRDNVIIARNCHISVYNAVELCGLNAEYIIPNQLKKFGINSSIAPQQVELALKKSPNTKLVVITSPTYEGVVSDIKSIADICHKYGAKLFVDEAHGAHFPFSEHFPAEAVQSGADAAVLSLHKTLPSLTQTALLITNTSTLINSIQQNLAVFESSSPSYILMSSIENCLLYLQNNKTDFDEYVSRLQDFYSKSTSLNHIKILGADKFNQNIFDYDMGKILISVANTDINGKELANILRENYNIELEMSYTSYALAMTSVCDTQIGFDMLYNALSEIDSKLSSSPSDSAYNISMLPQKSFSSSKRNEHIATNIKFDLAENKISLEYIWAYPPGIPLIVPGEIISRDLILHIKKLLNNNIDVYSSNGNLQNYISVVKTD